MTQGYLATGCALSKSSEGTEESDGNEDWDGKQALRYSHTLWPSTEKVIVEWHIARMTERPAIQGFFFHINKGSIVSILCHKSQLARFQTKHVFFKDLTLEFYMIDYLFI